MDDASLSAWLRVRENADSRSRSARLAYTIAATLPQGRPVKVLDLATGEGSNFRYLVERLPERQQWLLVDRSVPLLGGIETRTCVWGAARGHRVDSAGKGFTLRGPRVDCSVEVLARDLGGGGDSALFAERDLVTASALLDLVSESWLRATAAHCRAAGAAALFTISYDGRFSCRPAEPEDEYVRECMNAHQRRDKGLGGPAEGPQAADCAVRCFVDEGYRVASEASDWVLGPDEGAMQRTLIEGWADAATQVAPHEASTIASWRTRRLAHVDARRSHVIVGHRDVAAWRQ